MKINSDLFLKKLLCVASILFINSLISPALACSFMSIYTKLDIESYTGPAVKAVSPNFKVESIKRGSDDGNFASCSDAGVLKLRNSNHSSDQQGYVFEVVEGAYKEPIFSGDILFPDKLWHDKSLYKIIWFDGNTNEQEPFNILVKITAVSISGDKSEPQYLAIKHSGTKAQRDWIEVEL
ncbi:hypothetical protein MHM98_05815 [Psychrobium sp. MM17-31]|uniref:hypothetical protein n=1 Tax=Psychrobium sp. MM17-31 TaxID=2917758 RepID=UPI001EF5691D|nr:hypothetical protein [Psychrobium sp. MM17-31]MCG7530873.1 hypothetical protein [Psychrobium sp. MM17-31]